MNGRPSPRKGDIKKRYGENPAIYFSLNINILGEMTSASLPISWLPQPRAITVSVAAGPSVVAKCFVFWRSRYQISALVPTVQPELSRGIS